MLSVSVSVESFTVRVSMVEVPVTCPYRLNIIASFIVFVKKLILVILTVWVVEVETNSVS